MRLKLFVVAVALLLAVIFTLPTRDIQEPIYQGKSLTEWLIEIEYPPISGPETNHPLEIAVQAVKAIGTNGVPTYLTLVRARESSVKMALGDLLEKQSVIQIHFRRAKELNKYGLRGFQILGTNAQMAIPSLLKDLSANDPQLRNRASVALFLVGYKDSQQGLLP